MDTANNPEGGEPPPTMESTETVGYTQAHEVSGEMANNESGETGVAMNDPFQVSLDPDRSDANAGQTTSSDMVTQTARDQDYRNENINTSQKKKEAPSSRLICQDKKDAADSAAPVAPIDGSNEIDYSAIPNLPAALKSESVDDPQSIGQLNENCVDSSHGRVAAMPSGGVQDGEGKDEPQPFLLPPQQSLSTVHQDDESLDFSTQPFPTLQRNNQYPVVASSQPGAYAVSNYISSRTGQEQQEETLQSSEDATVPVPPEDITASTSDDAPNGDSNAVVEEIHGMAVANPCLSFSIMLPLARQVDQDDTVTEANARARKARQKAIPWVIAMVFLVILSIVVAVLLAVSFQGGDSPNVVTGSSEPFNALSNTSSIQQQALEDHVLGLLPDYTLNAMANSSSPQSLAFHFIVDDPSLSTYAEWKIRQRFALATFFHATGGEHWLESENWVTYSDECSWYSQSSFGISVGNLESEKYYLNPCDRGERTPNLRGEYKHLWLFKNGLSGSLPPELFWLTSLRSISVYLNDLEGSIPSTIGLLTGFEGMNIGATRLTGGIPSEIGMMTAIKYFVAQGTPLAGSIPSEIGLLSNLRYAVLMASQLSGTLPTELGMCESLEWLVLDQNLLTGPLPSQLGTIRGMEELRLFGQNLSSTIPTDLGNLSRLRSFLAFDNSLSGELPSELGSLSGIQRLQLDENRLKGSLPSEIGNLSNLTYVSLQNNFLTAEVPSEIGALTNLQFLYLQENQLEALPSELGRLTNLEWMLLHSNNLFSDNHEEIPLEIEALAMNQSFWWFDVSDDAVLSGIVPESICIQSAKDVNMFLFECSSVLCGCSCACRV